MPSPPSTSTPIATPLSTPLSLLLPSPHHPPPSPPSPRTLLEVAALPAVPLPASPSQAQPLLHSLVPLFEPLWLSDFLLSPQPLHRQHFYSANSPASFTHLHITSTSIPHAPLPPLQRPATHLDLDLLLSPAFLVGDLTLGFGVLTTVDFSADAAANQFHVKRHAASVIRFVRKESEGLFLIVTDIPEEQTIVITAWWNEKTTMSRMIKARFNRREFISLLRRKNGRLDAELLELSCADVQQRVQYRMCTECGSMYTQPCQCRRRVGRALHVFDYDYFRRGVMADIGIYEGSGWEISRTGDRKAFGVRTSVEGGSGREKEILEWAVGRGFLEDIQDRIDFTSISMAMGSNDLTITGIRTGTKLENDGFLPEERSEQPNFSITGSRTAKTDMEKEDLDSLTPEQLEKRRRALDRRERNRLAAQRSNLKKKLERDAMKTELRRLQEREEILREREASLRRDNALLKDLVSEKVGKL